MKTYKLKLIQAAIHRISRFTAFVTLALPMLAAVTPPNYSIQIVDERIQKNNLNDNPDIVGVSFECYRQKRAFELAKHYRKKGAKVIFGGVHSTANPEEMLKYCDSVVVGEAEELWPKLLKDFEKGKLKKIYSQKKPVDLSKLPQPRLDLLDMKRFTWTHPIQAARGCLYRCKFCFAKIINPKYRTFPIEYVVKQVKNSKHKWLFFMDDNFAADRENAIKILKAITPFKKKICFQANIFIGKDIELLRIMKKAGVVAIFAGMESINKKSLESVNKGFNKLKDYEISIKNFKKYSIEPKLGIIFGFDNDTKDIFKDTLEFLKKNKVNLVSPNFIIPYPGTEQYKMYEKEGRILTKNYREYDGRHLVVKPKSMTSQELLDGYKYFMDTYYSPSYLIRKIINNINSPNHIYTPILETITYKVIKIISFLRGEYTFARP